MKFLNLQKPDVKKFETTNTHSNAGKFWLTLRKTWILAFLFPVFLHAQTQFGPLIFISGFETDSPNAVITADVDNDGDTDVITRSGGDYTMEWFKNNGTGGFGPFQPISSEEFLSFSSVADIDNDGDLDILSSISTDVFFQENIISYLNDGTGQFTGPQICSGFVNGNVTSGFADDLDGDGDPDVLLTHYDGLLTKLVWFENDGTGNFGEEKNITPSGSLDYAQFIRTADLDNDGDKDVLSLSIDAGKVVWFKNNGPNAFGSQQTISTAFDNPDVLFPADLDNDGDLDLLLGAQTFQEPGGLYWFENFGTGTFAAPVTIDEGSVLDVHAADLDNDGDLDVLSAATSDDKIYWYENDGTGIFGPAQVIDQIALNANNVKAADLDLDGDLDVIASSSPNEITWYRNLLGTLAVPESTESTGSFKISPNPAGDEFTFQWNGTGEYALSLYDTAGRCIWREDNNFELRHRIDIRYLTSGLYVLQISSAGGIATAKLAKI
jgi:hypothetical protein